MVRALAVKRLAEQAGRLLAEHGRNSSAPANLAAEARALAERLEGATPTAPPPVVERIGDDFTVSWPGRGVTLEFQAARAGSDGLRADVAALLRGRELDTGALPLMSTTARESGGPRRRRDSFDPARGRGVPRAVCHQSGSRTPSPERGAGGPVPRLEPLAGSPLGRAGACQGACSVAQWQGATSPAVRPRTARPAHRPVVQSAVAHRIVPAAPVTASPLRRSGGGARSRRHSDARRDPLTGL
jgi:hypothetical protein